MFRSRNGHTANFPVGQGQFLDADTQRRKHAIHIDLIVSGKVPIETVVQFLGQPIALRPCRQIRLVYRLVATNRAKRVGRIVRVKSNHQVRQTDRIILRYVR